VRGDRGQPERRHDHRNERDRWQQLLSQGCPAGNKHLVLVNGSRRLSWPSSKLSCIENRQIGITTADPRKLPDRYDVTGHARQESFLDMARRAKGGERSGEVRGSLLDERRDALGGLPVLEEGLFLGGLVGEALLDRQVECRIDGAHHRELGGQ
jgi:hypothetical protein